MRITEASEYLGISINTLKAMADTGQKRFWPILRKGVRKVKPTKVGKNRIKYIEKIFDRPTVCKWFTPDCVNRNNFCRDVSPSFAKKEFLKACDFAKILDFHDGRFIVEIHQNNWFEIINRRLYQ